MAERVGFEPTLEFPLNTLSKRAPSATRPSLRRILIGTFTADGPRVGRQPDAFHYIWQLAIGGQGLAISSGSWQLAIAKAVGQKTPVRGPEAGIRQKNHASS